MVLLFDVTNSVLHSFFKHCFMSSVLPVGFCSLQELRLYLVWDSETISETTDIVVDSLFEAADCDSDHEGKAQKDRKSDKGKTKKSKKRSSSSSSSKSSSESDSSSKASKGVRDIHSTAGLHGFVLLDLQIYMRIKFQHSAL